MLHEEVCKQIPGSLYLVGPCPDGLIHDQHYTTIIPEYNNYKRVLIVRNPYTRIFGLWQHLVEWCRYNGNGCCDFKSFVDYVYEDNSELLSYMYRYTISKLIGDTDFPTWIKYENLHELTRNLLGIELPQVPKTWRKRIADYYDEEMKKKIGSWAEEDLHRWNYRWLEE